MSKESNEMKVLRAFVEEFSPFHSHEIVKEMTYNELFDIADEIVNSYNDWKDEV